MHHCKGAELKVLLKAVGLVRNLDELGLELGLANPDSGRFSDVFIEASRGLLSLHACSLGLLLPKL